VLVGAGGDVVVLVGVGVGVVSVGAGVGGVLELELVPGAVVAGVVEPAAGVVGALDAAGETAGSGPAASPHATGRAMSGRRASATANVCLKSRMSERLLPMGENGKYTGAHGTHRRQRCAYTNSPSDPALRTDAHPRPWPEFLRRS
jgi:hypothetical protein